MAITTPRLLLLAVALCSSVQAQFLTTGIQTVSLSMSGVAGSTPMNVAWNPVFQQYYGGRGGSPSYSGRVWNVSGAVVQTLTPINTDIRSFFYNANTGTIQDITYNAYSGTGNYGYKTVGLDAAGLFTGTYTDVGVALTGLPDSQVAPAYDTARNLLYAYSSGSTVTIVSAATGLAVSSLTLDLSTAGVTYLPSNVIGYDSFNDALISYTTTGGARALAFSAKTGAFLASVSLPGLTQYQSSWNMGYANNQLFVYDAATDSYLGFLLSPVPEPSTVGLLATGLALLGWMRFRRR